MKENEDSIKQKLYKKEFELEQKVKEWKLISLILLVVLGIVLASIFLYNAFGINIWRGGYDYRDAI